MRVGRWLQSESVVAAYVTNSPPDGLLFMGGYKFTTGGDMRQAFWARRFMTILPEPLMQQLCVELFPFLPTFQERAAKVPKQGRDIRLSVHYHAAALMFIAKATVQDSLELADRSPKNSVVQWLRHVPAWRIARSAYEHALKHGVSARMYGWFLREYCGDLTLCLMHLLKLAFTHAAVGRHPAPWHDGAAGRDAAAAAIPAADDSAGGI